MSCVKNYNPGKITMDLPTANYIYELPLLSFGDTHGSMNLSLVFNSEMRADTSNPFHVAAGYKLNVQKRLIMTNGTPTAYQDADGKCVSLYATGGAYLFADDSQRIIRSTDDACELENPDFSTEVYDTAGRIRRVRDKYNQTVLTYQYDAAGRLTYINYRGSKRVNFYYSSENQLALIAYNATYRLSLNHNTQELQVLHYSGVRYNISIPNSAVFNALAIATENNTVTTHSTTLTRTAENTVEIVDRINNEIVNSTAYVFPENATNYSQNFSQVEITNHFGVKTRMQFKEKKLLYTYEIGAEDAEFTGDKFKGSVQIHSVFNHASDIYAGGIQNADDGYEMTEVEHRDALKWTNSDELPVIEGDGYLCMLSGWVRLPDDQYSDEIDLEINNEDTCRLHYFLPKPPVGQWSYFAVGFKYNYSNLNVLVLKEYGNLEMKDIRYTFQATPSLTNNKNTKLPFFENVLIYHGGTENKYLPIIESTYNCGSQSIPGSSYVFPADILRYKINQRKGVNTTEFYYNKGRDVVVDAAAPGLTVTYNGETYNLSECYLGVCKCTANGVVTTQIIDDDEEHFLVYRTQDANGDIIFSQILDGNLDVVSSSADGITTIFERDNGLVISETVNENTNDTQLYTRSMVLGSDQAGNPTITTKDEFEYSTVYTLDPVWGGVKSVTLPDGTVVTDEYDDDMCAMTKRIFGSATGRSNVFTYSGGNLSALQTGNLGYDFTYTAGKLTGISKNDTAIEEHVHADATAEAAANTASFYPSQNAPLHSTVARFDKYGRVSQIDGVLKNTYDICPTFDATTGALVATRDDRDSLLAMTEDLVQGEVARYSYNNKKQLIEKTVTDAEDFSDVVSKDTFTYDAANRMTLHRCTYDIANTRSVQGSIVYATEATSASADSRIATYLYRGAGATVTSKNTYNDFKQITKKTHAIGLNTYERSFTYNKTRVTKLTETLPSKAVGTSQYSYDEMGRIDSIIDSQSGSNTNFRTYVYDQYGQLVRENNKALDKSYVYVYNDIGNLTSVQAYPYSLTGLTGTPVTTTFGYTGDKLTSFGGTTIAYNAMGCPTTYEGKTATWSKGRLSRLFKGTLATGTSNYNYSYNALGQRVSKSYSYLAGTSGNNPVQAGQVTAYSKDFFYDHSGRLIAESGSKTYYGTGAESESIVYLYDESAIIGMEHTVGTATTRYYFQRNLQGDVVAIYNANGVLKAKYLYDAWGNCTISNDTTDYALASANPIRYRGYYFDEDTGLYYCNARYYSPKWRRFISPDSTSYLAPESPNGLNLYCYCHNDPVNYADPSGHLAVSGTILLAAIIGGAIAGASISTISYFYTNEDPTVGGVVGAFTVGAVVGGLGGAAGALGGYWAIGLSVAAGAVSGVYTGIMTDGPLGQKVFAGLTATVISGGGAYLGTLISLDGMSFGYTLIGNAIFGGTIGGYLEILNVIIQGWIGKAFQNRVSIMSGAYSIRFNPGLDTISAFA